MPADGALFLKAHGGPSLVLFVPADAISSTLGIGKEIPKPENLWNTKSLWDRYPTVGRRSGRQPNETKGEG
jgi:hypothetical protein